MGEQVSRVAAVLFVGPSARYCIARMVPKVRNTGRHGAVCVYDAA
jgi:hypothetical protein